MEIVLEVIIGIAAVLAAAGVICAVKSLLLTPVRPRENVEVLAVIRARGDGAGLEETVRGLLWLRDTGKAELKLLVADCGMDVETLRRAEILSLQTGVELVGTSELRKRAEGF